MSAPLPFAPAGLALGLHLRHSRLHPAEVRWRWLGRHGCRTSAAPASPRAGGSASEGARPASNQGASRARARTYSHLLTYLVTHPHTHPPTHARACARISCACRRTARRLGGGSSATARLGSARVCSGHEAGWVGRGEGGSSRCRRGSLRRWRRRGAGASAPGTAPGARGAAGRRSEDRAALPRGATGACALNKGGAHRAW